MFKNDEYKGTRKQMKNLFSQLVNSLCTVEQFELLALQLDRTIDEQDELFSLLTNEVLDATEK